MAGGQTAAISKHTAVTRHVRSWKNADNKSVSSCLATKDPCPPGHQQICVGNQLAWCTPDRQAIALDRGDNDGYYCMVSPVDGEAYWAFQDETCAPDGTKTECEVQCDVTRFLSCVGKDPGGFAQRACG